MRRLGFTLIELLVVISIIALLMAVLVPSLRSSREQVKATLCRSNIRQLALGLTMYENDNETFPHALDETIFRPPPGGHPGNLMHDRMGWWWFNHITAYSKRNSNRPSVTLCPSRKINSNTLKNNVLCGNYGVNRSICRTSCGKPDPNFTGRPLRVTGISRASETLLVLDSGYSMITWQHASDPRFVSLGSELEDTAYIPGLEINKDRSLWPGQEQDAIEGRHPDKTVNVGFADGHVDKVKAEGLFVENIAGSYRNKSPLWQPK